MQIAIKSEIDSRPFLYPLMRALRSFGSIIVISNNSQLLRLIDDEDEGGFRNIRVIVDNGTADEILDQYGIAENDYDFIIHDNLDSILYDKCIILLGMTSTIRFSEDIQLMEEDEPQKIYKVQFGHSLQQNRTKNERGSKEKKERVRKEYDPADKFRERESDAKKEVIRKISNVPFPSYQDIESFEATHRFYDMPKQLIAPLYDILKDDISVTRVQFEREVLKKDASSGYYKHR